MQTIIAVTCLTKDCTQEGQTKEVGMVHLGQQVFMRPSGFRCGGCGLDMTEAPIDEPAASPVH